MVVLVITYRFDTHESLTSVFCMVIPAPCCLGVGRCFLYSEVTAVQLGKCFLQPSGDFHADARILESVTRYSNPSFASVEISKLKQQGWEEPFRYPVSARGGNQSVLIQLGPLPQPLLATSEAAVPAVCLNSRG